MKGHNGSERSKQSRQLACWLLNHSQYVPELATAGRLPGQHLVQGHAKGVDVHLGVAAVIEQHLRGCSQQQYAVSMASSEHRSLLQLLISSASATADSSSSVQSAQPAVKRESIAGVGQQHLET